MNAIERRNDLDEFNALLNSLKRNQSTKREESYRGLALTPHSTVYEIRMSRMIRAVVLSSDWEGGILVFNDAGQFTNSIKTYPINSFQLVDFNSDGVAEIITDEVEGRGTGILDRKYHIYRFYENKLHMLWKDQSIFYSEPFNESEKDQWQEKQGFLRPDNDGFTFCYLDYKIKAGHHQRFRWEDGTFIEDGAPQSIKLQ